MDVGVAKFINLESYKKAYPCGFVADLVMQKLWCISHISDIHGCPYFPHVS